ncbi:uncharacterized protein UV8b_05692 [Ustilaginoidea virens]|uniref:Uncharacterized protein n=1 Tax=Ustilaginoidea virens TaxID=1159556 RepID=A0A8E5HUE7_USTVR|nr:uncharacterized protein UV8b_05692 [Ustilaginoidea virens]QUC21449.1 hypothetical protein UV8b_05692 [Ustilaginoidea virens]
MQAILPDAITEDEFHRLLSQYPSVVQDSGTAKPGQPSLQALDQLRYVDFPQTFHPQRGTTMDQGHVEKLVEWKLRHGKFRPSLTKLIASNDPVVTKSTIAAAVAAYRHAGTPQAVGPAVGQLTRLKGVGPATASLLLSVHDPRVIFFSDEAYWWLCCGGQRRAIRYNASEYADLCSRATVLADRLGVVDMAQVEKVAYVLLRRSKDPGKGAVETARRGKRAGEVAAGDAARSGDAKGTRAGKRKTVDAGEGREAGLRRSKRQKG